MEDGICARVPDKSQTGSICEKELIPYGAAKLRMTEMPLLTDSILEIADSSQA